MSKIRVHELAKALDKSNKEVIQTLNSLNIEVKSHMSALTDEDAARVRQSYGKSAPASKPESAARPAEAKPAEAKPAAAKPAGESAAQSAAKPSGEGEPVKKKKITGVFHPQNSRSGKAPAGRPAQRRPEGQSRPAPERQGAERRPAPKPEERVAAQSVRTESRPVQENRGSQDSRPAQDVRNRQDSRPVQDNRPGQDNRGRQNDRPGQDNRNRQNDRPGQDNRGRQDNRSGQDNRGRQDNRYGQDNRNRQNDRPGQDNRGRQDNRPGQDNRGRQDNRYGQDNRNRQNDRPGQDNRGRQDNRPGQDNRGRQDNRYGQDNRNRQGGRPGQDSGSRQGQGGGNFRSGGRNKPSGGLVIPESRAKVEERPSKEDRSRKEDRNRKEKAVQEDRFAKKKNRPNQGGNRPNQGNKNRNRGAKPQPAPQPKKEENEIKSITLPEVLTIKELADKMKQQPSALIKKLFLQGKVVTVNQEIDYDTAEEIALEFNCIAEPEIKVDVIEELLKEEDDAPETLTARPPVVCVMGHVDHGKTSLLDAIRNTNVIEGEAGGITQHIGAYVVKINGQKITFLDTPGHEAFTSMRMRGANSTDIAILVVAADDGVMPQTVEAINHAKAAGIEIIVAVNKIDKPSANIDRVKQELAEYQLIPEDWGGDTVFVPVSAKSREGIEQLLEMVLLTSEMLELKANPDRTARGLVIEAELDKGKGSVATVLVQKGTLHVGDPIAVGSCYGKVRAMMDDKGRRVKEAGPSTPVEILGLGDVPGAGEIFVATESDKEARSFAETYIAENRTRMLDETKSKLSLDDLFTQIQAGNVKELGIVVKADVQGSVEAVKQSLEKLSNEEVVVKVIHGGVGAINESDVILASASNAIIIGFNVRPDATAKSVAESEHVDMRLYRVIYNAIEDVEAAMKGMLDPVFEEKILGHAEIRQTFKASGVGTIAGSYVLDGYFERNCSVRLTRDNVVIFEGPLASLKRFKDDVKEVKSGFECGFVFEKFNDIKEGDMVEAFAMVEIPR